MTPDDLDGRLAEVDHQTASVEVAARQPPAIAVPDELIQNSEPDPYQACMDKVRSAMLGFADLNDGCRVPGPAPQ